jgi:urease accessory protein
MDTRMHIPATMRTTTTTGMSTTMTDADYMLLCWASPSYPTGAFAYSHGLEYCVETGSVHDAASLEQFVVAWLQRGGGWIDAVLFSATCRAASDPAALDDAAAEAAAWRGTGETALEAWQQGEAFLAVTLAAWPHPDIAAFAVRNAGRKIAQVTVFALAAIVHGIAPDRALGAFLHAGAANLVSAGVRLVPLGQTDGQRITASLAAPISACCKAALVADPEAVGTSTLAIELASMAHETQHSRLFRS